jgi:hypothetical protein
MATAFAVTWDYRCPFARNAHEHILTGLAGVEWDVRFLPFSLGQVHVEDGALDVWAAPQQDTGILALQAGVVVRDEFAAQFAEVHRALFAVRHDKALQPNDREVIGRVLREHGVPASGSSRAARSTQDGGAGRPWPGCAGAGDVARHR